MGDLRRCIKWAELKVLSYWNLNLDIKDALKEAENLKVLSYWNLNLFDKLKG